MSEKKLNEINTNNHYGNHGVSLILLLMLLQLIMIPWVCNIFYYWSDGETSTFLPFVISLLISPLICVLIINNKGSKIFSLFNNKMTLIILLIALAIVDILMYMQFARILVVGNTLPIGWTATEKAPVIYLSLWAAITFMGIIPTCIGLLNTTIKNKTTLAFNSHLSLMILFFFLAIRWGGSWSAPLYNMIFNLVLIPIFYIQKFETSDKDDCEDHEYHADQEYKFPGSNQNISIIFMFGFWFSVLEFQMALQLSQTWIYFIPAIVNGFSHILFRNHNSSQKWIIDKKMGLIIWILLTITSFCIVFTNIWTLFIEIRELILIFGLIFASILPEITQNFNMIRKQTIIPRLFYTAFAFMFGLLIPIIINIYDPISSYVVLFLITLTFIIGLLGILSTKKEKRKII